MLMLGDGGQVRANDSAFELRGSFVLLARPGQYYEYGPFNQWDEYGFCFRESAAPAILGDFPADPWPVKSIGLVREQLAQVDRLLSSPGILGVVDQLDLLAGLTLLTSYHGSAEDVLDEPERRLLDAEAWLRAHFHEPIRLPDLARRFHFSEPTFRRQWSRRFDRPPGEFIRQLRLEEAMRLLHHEPGLRINEIALRCGFPDQRHFATAFRQATGMSPTEFRENQPAPRPVVSTM